MTRSSTDLLLDLLRGRLFHCTGLPQFRQILKDGFIRPNTDQRPFSFHKTEYSYGYSIGAICLFDFKDQPQDLCREWYFRGWSPYRDESPVTIFLALDHEWLHDKLIPNSAARAAEPYKHYIPYIEVWCKEWIPVDTITACIVCSNVDHGEFTSTQGNDRLSEWVEQKVTEFQARYADAYKEKEKQLKMRNSFYRRTALN